jgi:hypothetical protein
MNRRRIIGMCATAALVMSLFVCRSVAQQKSAKEQLLGAWSLVSIEFVRPDGSRLSTFGAGPRGIAFFDAGGHYIITVMRSDRANYAINNFAQGTAEENKATAQGALTYFGTYSVSEADRTIAIHIEGSSFPNWNGTDQKRTFAITGDELKLISPAATGAGTAEVLGSELSKSHLNAGQVLSITLIGISPRPAGSSRTKLHRFSECVEGGAMSLPGPEWTWSRAATMSAPGGTLLA